MKKQQLFIDAVARAVTVYNAQSDEELAVWLPLLFQDEEEFGMAHDLVDAVAWAIYFHRDSRKAEPMISALVCAYPELKAEAESFGLVLS